MATHMDTDKIQHNLQIRKKFKYITCVQSIPDLIFTDFIISPRTITVFQSHFLLIILINSIYYR